MCSSDLWEILTLPAPLFFIILGCVVLVLALCVVFLCCCCYCGKDERGRTTLMRSLRRKASRRSNPGSSSMNQLVSPDSGNTTSRSAQENAASPSDVTVDIMKTLQDAVKRQVDNFCLDSDRLETHEIIGRGRVDLCRD